MAKIIVNELDHQGVLKLGHNVKLGYFAQNQAEFLDGEKTVLDIMLDEAKDHNRSKVRDMLGAFLFRGDDVDKKTKVLSGGERNRLALCKMLLDSFNVLVMDEPTNHLDIKSKKVLKEALRKFEGTLILVSHDRDFLQGLTESVYEFKAGHVREFLGTIDDYLEERRATDFRAIEKKTAEKTEKTIAQKSLNYNDQKKVKQLKNKISKTESQIADLERELKTIEEELSKNHQIASDSKFIEKYSTTKQRLEQCTEIWYELTEALQQYD